MVGYCQFRKIFCHNSSRPYLIIILIFNYLQTTCQKVDKRYDIVFIIKKRNGGEGLDGPCHGTGHRTGP
jgi:hypothetical protein